MADVNATRGEVYVEVGLGAGRRRGYGNGFPFKAGDHYLAFDMPIALGNESRPYGMGYEPATIYLAERALEAAEASGVSTPGLPLAGLMDLEIFAAEKDITFSPVYADGRKLPLRDKSVQEVLFTNVIGDPDMRDYPRLALLNEAKRVVKDGGRIVLAETYTPDVAKRFMEGLDASEWPRQVVDSSHPQWADYRTRYGGALPLDTYDQVYLLEA